MSGYPTARAVSKVAGRDRILIDGVDVTFFRSKVTPFPGYSLSEPFAYGATTLSFPQIHASHESLGVGELSWVRTGAQVVIQRVDDPLADTPTVIATDYIGVVVAKNINGRELSLDVGGWISGRAALRYRPSPLFRQVRDVGLFMANFGQEMGVSFASHTAVVTGVNIANAGDMSSLAWAQQMCSLTQVNETGQYTLMPQTWGGSRWEFRQKDYATKHLTIYTDDARAVANLSDDASEQPNTYFGKGTAPDGELWQNGRRPGIIQGAPPVYPMSGGDPMTIGTTDADTTSGSGVFALIEKLNAMGYRDYRIPWSDTYDSVVAAAVKRLQADAGLSQTGTMTTAAWDALFDLSVTGYSFTDTTIFPILQESAVRQYNYTSNGSIVSKNTVYDPRVLRVDRFIDFGPGVEKSTGIEWAFGAYSRQAAKNWAGTIRLNGSGAFTGEHDGDDAESLDASDLMPYRDIRPGMNAWLPLFDGGTLVHISGVQVDADGATLTVDTQARDLMELSQVIARDRDASRNIRREWQSANRQGRASGNLITWDEFGGRLAQDVELEGGKWNVVPVVVGQHGQVNRTDIRVTGDLIGDDSETGFCMAVFSRNVTPAYLNRRVGNPFPVNSDGESVWERDSLVDLYDDGILLYSAGTTDQPCGYWPRKHKGPAGGVTAADVTGRWRDDSPWPYICAPGTAVLVFVAIYPAADGVLKRGRLFFKQEDDAV